jgi:sugar phosphate isomerase/epimerase
MRTDLEDISLCIGPLFANPFECDITQFDEVLEATAAAGFRGVSYWAMQQRLLAAAGVRVDRERFATHGLSVRVVEAAMQWATGDRALIDAEIAPLLDLASEMQAEHVMAVTMDAGPLDLDSAADGLAYLSDRAAVRGLRVSVEFLPWSAIADLATAWSLVQRVAHDNCGLVLDTWHWQRQPGGPQPELLATIPGERIHILQLCDTARVAGADLLDETMNGRLLPGKGSVDFASLFATLEQIGAEPFIAPEVFNPSLAAAGPSHFALQIADATRALLAANGA